MDMDLGLKGKSAAVMAATDGLGKAVAEALLEEGAHVAISGRNSDRLAATLADFSRFGDAVTAAQLDVLDTAQLTSHLEEVRRARGTVHILVTNAGGPPTGLAADASLADLDTGYELTLKSAVAAISTVLPWMQAQKWGRIIAMTSSSVRQPIENLVMSNTMRAGLTGFIKTLSREVARDGVLVNSICTGMFMTERLKELFSIRAEESGRSIAEEQRLMELEIPVGRIGDPAEFGSMVAFMASEKASFLNGVALPYDGGAGRFLL
jgi:3-oxoacyl-[acyl-carrier protein] reductase